MLSRLRITTAWFCLVLCIGFVALLVQSYSVTGILAFRFADAECFALSSRRGNVEITSFNSEKLPGEQSEFAWGWQFIPRGGVNPVDICTLLGGPSETDYLFILPRGLKKLSIPHWFLILLTGGFAILLKPKPRLRFSLRELLLLTTITAVVLGAVAGLGRIGN